MTLYNYTILHLELLSKNKEYSQRFQAQAFHRYVIQYIVSYRESFLGKTENTPYILRKSTRFRNQATSKSPLIIRVQGHSKYAIRLQHNSRKVILTITYISNLQT